MFTIVALAVLLVNGTADHRRYPGPVFASASDCNDYRLSGDNAASVADLADYLFAHIAGLQSVATMTACETDGAPA